MRDCEKCQTAMQISQQTMRHIYSDGFIRRTTIATHWECVVCGFYLYTKEVIVNEQVS